MSPRRPLADRLELVHPVLTRTLTRLTLALPTPMRRRVLIGAFARAEAAFNRGDLEVVFAAFGPDVVYQPPRKLPGARPIRGKEAVLSYWRGILDRFETNRIENLEVVETGRGTIRRRARLRHENANGEELGYEILQTTQIMGGEVVKQVNELAAS